MADATERRDRIVGIWNCILTGGWVTEVLEIVVWLIDLFFWALEWVDLVDRKSVV